MSGGGKAIKEDAPYYRDIPCNGNLYRAYYIAKQCGLNKKKTNILGAIILKWLKDDLIKIEQKEANSIFKKGNTVIILNQTDKTKFTDEKESSLFYMLLAASKDGILENKEFEKWCTKSYSRILGWFDDIIEREENKLINEGLITVQVKTKLKVFKQKIYTFTSMLKQEAIQLVGLKKYLLDYTLIKERETIDVHLFEEYLIYAQILGIAKEVAKEFKDLYPEVIEASHFTSYNNILFIHACVSSGISHANSAKKYSSGSFGGGRGRRRFSLKYKKCSIVAFVPYTAFFIY